MTCRAFFTISLIVLGAVAGFRANAQELRMVPGESTVGWKATKVTGGHDGKVRLKAGTMEFKDGVLVMSDVVVDMTSITCEDIQNENTNTKLVNHLRSADFFDVERHGEAHFRTTRVELLKEDTYRITGDLVIKGTAHPNTFDMVVKRDKRSARATGTLTFDRTNYDIKYRSGSFFEGLGDRMIHDSVTLELDIVAR
jgi:polyisoprenoid-binding protein YceI